MGTLAFIQASFIAIFFVDIRFLSENFLLSKFYIFCAAEGLLNLHENSVLGTVVNTALCKLP